MEFWKSKPSCDQVRELDMVQYLSSIGHEPVIIKGNNYWYFSPFRLEKTPSFKINRKLNRFYDFGIGWGGNLIDFCTLYYNCSVSDFLHSFTSSTYLQQPVLSNKEVLPDCGGKINILQSIDIKTPSLLRYLHSRNIPLHIASRYCTEVHYCIEAKPYYAIGFKNDKAGYEIRNRYFKGSSSPKSFTTIRNGGNNMVVFEGFFDFLSFLVIHGHLHSVPSDFLILNSLSFFEQARPMMESYETTDLYLDNNNAGKNCSRYALSVNCCYIDKSDLYKDHEDLNDFLCGIRMDSPDEENLFIKPPS